MNDGPAPKRRSIFSVFVPYILMALTVGLFIWLIVSQTVGKPVTWTRDQLDDYLGYSLNVNQDNPSESKYTGDPFEDLEYRVYAIEVKAKENLRAKSLRAFKGAHPKIRQGGQHQQSLGPFHRHDRGELVVWRRPGLFHLPR